MPDTFRDLHSAGRPLVLPNAWDVASALAFLDAGFTAIGTTSFGVSAVLGRPDGDRVTAEANRALADALAPLPCHVSVDVENGYSDDPDEVADYLADLPAAGVNIEDSLDGRLVAPESHAAKIAAVKRRRPDLFVNARVDTYWFGVDTGDTLARASLYVEAGADGVFVPFVPGAMDAETLRALTKALDVPVNVLASPTWTVDELGALGVRRVSSGSLPYRAALGAAVEAVTALRDGRSLPPAPSYADVQKRLSVWSSRLRAHGDGELHRRDDLG